jgi:hypothetical protein
MTLAIKSLDNGGRLSEATAQELNAVSGGAYLSLFHGTGVKGDYGVAIFETGIAWVNADGSYGFHKFG